MKLGLSWDQWDPFFHFVSNNCGHHWLYLRLFFFLLCCQRCSHVVCLNRPSTPRNLAISKLRTSATSSGHFDSPHTISFFSEEFSDTWSEQRSQVWSRECLPGYYPGNNVGHLFLNTIRQLLELMQKQFLYARRPSLSPDSGEQLLPTPTITFSGSESESGIWAQYMAGSRNLINDFVC